MINLIKPNWDVFKAKFSENPNSNFEWFCYLLFCKENGKSWIHGFKNQTAIETEPIQIDDAVIGFQAKFYTTTLSSNIKELLKELKNAKTKYPNLTKYIIYTNQEWGMSLSKPPKAKTSLEALANTLIVELEVRTANYFKSKPVVIDAKIISEYFFTSSCSLLSLIEEQNKHTKSILNPIKGCISLNNGTLEIPRNNQLNILKNEVNKISIVHGVAGAGKTAIIKNLYEQLESKIPFFVFKATEFKLDRLDSFFYNVNYNVNNFIDAYEDESFKIIVIDSAEKLLDIENTEPFKEFFVNAINKEWSLIFTIRSNYLTDLHNLILDLCNISPEIISVNHLESNELNSFSNDLKFTLPKDVKLLELIKTPFYLGKYLEFYSCQSEQNYVDFKSILWNTRIKNGKIGREESFLQLAFKRANNGGFFIIDSSNDILNELVQDGILGYEQNSYFITHDIYEEWALEKIIDRAFTTRENDLKFFENIQESLAIRRSFRNWLSEKLLLNDDVIKDFIKNSTSNQNIQQFWRDEILIAVLLSDYSEQFLNIFSPELLANQQGLLKKLTFLLRLACKEVDDDLLKQYGIENTDLFCLEYVITKPKGSGWNSVIRFVYENLSAIVMNNIIFIIPIIHDWNTKFKEGGTTKQAALIALYYYKYLINDKHHIDDDTEKKLLQTILYGALEIKNELNDLADNILENRWNKSNAPFYNFSKFVLSPVITMNKSYIYEAIPVCVIKLADLFWITNQKEISEFPVSIQIEQHFGLDHYNFQYYPASAYQTPVYSLLFHAFKDTIDFILQFTNKSISQYATSGYDNSLQEVTVIFSNNTEQKQYLSNCIWELYRGTGHPRSPYLLQSVHMALEKYLLEDGEKIEARMLEKWLLYLLKSSHSASISAIVTSIVLAYPDKTFNIAKILFRIREFILHDNKRYGSDKTIKNLYSIGYKTNQENDFYIEERLHTCKHTHRNSTLEQLIVYYQHNQCNSVVEIKERQRILWEILDEYYAKLPDESSQTDEDKAWRIYLARMDIRQDEILAIPKINEVHIQPKLAPELEVFSKNDLTIISEQTKYLCLEMWAKYKLNNNPKYKEYLQYDNSPRLALQETTNILENQSVYTLNHSTPVYVCVVLIRDHLDVLSEEEQLFCKNLILETAWDAVLAIAPPVNIEVSKSTISLLPTLLEIYSEEQDKIQDTLLLALLNDYPVDFWGGSLSSFIISKINLIWDNYLSTAQYLFYGYLLIKPKYDEIMRGVSTQALETLILDNRTNIHNIINTSSEIDLNTIYTLDIHFLRMLFKLISPITVNVVPQKIALIIIEIFAQQMLAENPNRKINVTLQKDFFEAYANFILNLPNNNEIEHYLKPFIENFNTSDAVGYLFEEFIYTADKLNTHLNTCNFWIVWNIFKDKIMVVSTDKTSYYHIKKTIKSYLFATIKWKNNTKEWHALKDSNAQFFTNISENLGQHSSVIYSIAKLLNDIGAVAFIDHGIGWISSILTKFSHEISINLEINTVYYIEQYIRKYISNNYTKIRRTIPLKTQILRILDFLIEKGSVIGYSLRERVI